MKLPSMSLRLAMTGVALIAVVLGVGSRRLFARRADFIKDAAYHARREAEEQRVVAFFDQRQREGTTNTAVPDNPKVEQASRLRLTYHSELKRKYLRAATHPWEPVPPDPPDPGDSLMWDAIFMPTIDFPNARMNRFNQE